jgi:tyrosine-protein phosphatase SIW14
MRVSGKLSFTLIAASSVLVLLSVAQAQQPQAQQPQAQQSVEKQEPKTRIKNFGCINATYYRGAQPKESDYSDLAAMGVKTVVDLQRDYNESEQKWAENAGLKFYRIKMSDKDAPTDAQVAEFLKIVNDPANQPIFVHCKGGRHRTGLVTAVYRMTHDGWNFDKAFAEMMKYDFGYGFGHGPLKNYVYGYYSAIDRKKDVVVTNANN